MDRPFGNSGQTIWDYMFDLLLKNGMRNDAVNEFAESAKNDETIRWCDNIWNYTPHSRTLVISLIRRVAVNWIDDNHEFETKMGLISDDTPLPACRAKLEKGACKP